MESVPLIPKAKVLLNLDASPLIKELFQDEFQAVVPSKKVSKNIITSLHYQKLVDKEKETYRSVEYEESLAKRKDNLIGYAENVFEAYVNHEKNLEDIRNAEKNVFKNHALYLKRETVISENKAIQDLLKLKRQPLFKALNLEYVNKYKLLQGEAGLPPQYEANSDFRVQNFKKWRRRLESISQDSLIMNCLNDATTVFPCFDPGKQFRLKKEALPIQPAKVSKTRRKKPKAEEKKIETFRAEPKMVCFKDFKPGDNYITEIHVKNVHTKGMTFQLKPMSPDGPFKVTLKETNVTKIFPGLSIQLIVEFTPTSLDNIAEDVCINIEGDRRLAIPLIAYLEPPILKTHRNINELTRVTEERIASSYIECGACFTGDSKVTKLRFRCFRGSGEFFIMNIESWTNSYVNTVTFDNLLEIPPFRVYPVFFKINTDQVIDLFVEFLPKTSGTHVENLVIACDNGEVRSLDLLADAVGWHSYYFTFQDNLLKDLPIDEDDDIKVKYYLNFTDTMPNGKAEKVFCVANNSNMAFEFQWKIREANILFDPDKYLKLAKNQVKIDPENGTFEPNSVRDFAVTITFNNAEIGDYRMILSLYVLNLPYQCIEEDTTIIQPTGFVRNLYSQSLYGEEEFTTPSPELLSLQGTYESLQESIKSYAEYQSKVHSISKYDFSRSTFAPTLNPKSLKKSRTFLNIGDTNEDEGLSCICRGKLVEADSISESYTSNVKDEKFNESSEPRNEVVWDFVDVLVDEIELWVEVVPTRVTLEPCIIELCMPLTINDPPLLRQVRVINHNGSPINCEWLKPSNALVPGEKCVSSKFKKNFFPFTDNEKIKNMYESTLKNTEPDFKSSEMHKQNRPSKTTEEQSNKADGKKTNQNYRTYRSCSVAGKPEKSFTVPGLSEFACDIEISACQQGKINEELHLSINDGDFLLKLLVMGTAVEKYIIASPEILDFGVLKQGTRYAQKYKITNQRSDPLYWRINQFEFDFKRQKFCSLLETDNKGCQKKKEGLLETEGSSVIENHYIDAKVPGIRCSLLEIQCHNLAFPHTFNQYILVLGDVKVPLLSLSSARFENAILAPARMMYVGQKTSTKVILSNKGKVDTFFTWGHPFGCHSRKMKVDISPKHCKIEQNQKLIIDITLTPLDEGIINHCYVPCFFCRSAQPLILSIIGISENVNVTFEIIDYPRQTHADTSNFLKSPFYHTVLRIPWPVKNFDPNLGLKYVNEEDILSMKCQCSEVEEEVNRVSSKKQGSASKKSLESNEDGCANMNNKNCPVTTTSDFKGSWSIFDKDLSKETCVQKFSSRGSSIETLQFNKYELEFVNVPFQTPITRQFVIRNETPVKTSFQIRVLNFGQSKDAFEKRIVTIKNRVLGYSKDDFKSKMSKVQPLLITVEPSEGELLGLDAVCINVCAYGNTWGEYRDNILCRIKGIQHFHLKVYVQVVGHPINFPMFDNQIVLKPVLRFQTLSYTSKPVSKSIRVLNTSAIPLTICWLVFLSEPLLKVEEHEESFNLCADSNANLDSNHSGEESSKSTKVYLPKNTTESVSAYRNMVEMVEMKDFSHQSETFETFLKTDSISDKNESQELGEGEMLCQSNGLSSQSEHAKSELETLCYGQLDSHTFQVNPKEITFEPFEEKKLTITFDPSFLKPKTCPFEFKGTLIGFVKLKPEDEESPGNYCRPCGTNYASELLSLNVILESSFVSFEILKGDLKFFVDSNAVITSTLKQLKISRKFLIRNNNQKSVFLKIEITPGVIFHVRSVNTRDKFYEQYNSEKHQLIIKSGQLLEVELECTVTSKDVSYAFEHLKLNRSKKTSVKEIKQLKLTKSSNDSEDDMCMNPREKMRKESMRQELSNTLSKKPFSTENCHFVPKNSYQINVNRMSSNSERSICHNFSGRRYFAEVEGEYLELPWLEESFSKPPQHVTVIKEEVSFIQTGLITQNLVAELILSFPMLRLSPKHLDFGNVYIGETAKRYCSLINLTGFPTDFKAKSKMSIADFAMEPLTGSIPSTNYNADIGRTITVKFKPSQPGYISEIFRIYCNTEMEFDFYELFVAGFGTWNEKHKFFI